MSNALNNFNTRNNSVSLLPSVITTPAQAIGLPELVRLLEEPMDLDTGSSPAAAESSSPMPATTANPDLKQADPPGSSSSKYADPAVVLCNAIQHQCSVLNKMVVRYQQALSSSDKTTSKKVLADREKTKEALQPLWAVQTPEYVQQTPAAPYSRQSRISIRDIPVFQLVGSNIWRPDKEVFDSVDHFLSAFPNVLRLVMLT